MELKPFFKKNQLLALVIILIGFSGRVGFCSAETPGMLKRIQVSTLNVWGLPYLSKFLPERLGVIASDLKTKQDQVALLQESWTGFDQTVLAKGSQAKNSFVWGPLGTPAEGSPFGSGLQTLTWGVEASSLHFASFSLNGRNLRLSEGDRLTRKGVGGILVSFKGVLWSIYNIHTLARYGTENVSADEYTPERLAQLFQAFRAIILSYNSPNIIIGGDFNAHKDNEEMRFWNTLTGFLGTDLNQCTLCPENPFADKTPKGQIDWIFVSPNLDIPWRVRDFDHYFRSSDSTMITESDHFGLTALVTKRVDSPLALKEKLLNNLIWALTYLDRRLQDYSTWAPLLSATTDFSDNPLSYQEWDSNCSTWNVQCQIHEVRGQVALFLRTSLAIRNNKILLPSDREGAYLQSRLLRYFSEYK